MMMLLLVIAVSHADCWRCCPGEAGIALDRRHAARVAGGTLRTLEARRLRMENELARIAATKREARDRPGGRSPHRRRPRRRAAHRHEQDRRRTAAEPEGGAGDYAVGARGSAPCT